MSLGHRLLFALTLIVGVAGTSLAGWQLNRLFDRRAVNRRARADLALPLVDLDRAGLPGLVVYRPVRVSGRFDYDRELLLRNRLFQGNPGVQVITPLRIAGRDTAVLVNRGFVPTPDAGAIRDPSRYREPDSAALTGIAIAVPDQGDGMALSTPRGETWRRLDLTAIRGRLPYPVAPYYVIATAETGAHTLRGHSLPLRVEPPPLDDGPHLSYAIQWLLIGGSAVGFGFFFIRKGAQRRPAAG